MSSWFPKSVVGTSDNIAELRLRNKNYAVSKSTRFNIGSAYNSYLYSLDKKSGVKGVRERMRTETLKNKLENNDVSFNSLDDFKNMPAKTVLQGF